MCKLKDIILSGLQDLKSQKKRNRISFILIFLSLVTYIGVNSHINSVSDGLNASMEFLESRIIIDTVQEGMAEERLALLEELYGDDERVRQMSLCTTEISLEWIQASDVLYTDSARVPTLGCYDAVLDYDYEGEKRIPEENEIILPRYLCEVGIYDTKNLGDGDALIGQTIKMRYETPNNVHSQTIEFKVIGTYDNLKARSSGCICFINPQLALDLQELKYDDDVQSQEELKMIFGDEAYEVTKDECYSIYVEEGYDVDAFIEEIYEATDGEILFMRYKMLDDSMIGYFEYVIQIGNLISVMLLFVAVINIIISSINEVKDRKWEFALKMSMGYTRNDIIGIFFVEKLVNLIKALLLSVLVVGLYSIVVTFISRTLLEYWKREYLYIIYPQNVVIAIFLVVITGLIGTLVARITIKDINVAKELKSGE